MPYTEPRIVAKRRAGLASVLLRGGNVLPVLIGTSNGKRTSVAAYAALMGAGLTYTFSGLGSAGPVATLTKLRTKASGGLVYVAGVDFTFDAETQVITWSSTSALKPPYLMTVAEVAGSSSLVSGTTYSYVVAAYRTLNVTGPSLGETAASNEVGLEISASSKRAKLTWQVVPGAEGYKIYRTTTTGLYTGTHLLATVAGEFSDTYTDDGTVSLQAGSPLGVPVYAVITATGLGTYNLAPSQTLLISVDGAGATTVTFTATAASRAGTAASYPVTIDGTNDTLSVTIDGGSAQVVTLTHGSRSAIQIATDVSDGILGGSASGGTGQLVVTSDRSGSGSHVALSGNASTILGITPGTSNGAGNVSDIDAVTATEVIDAINAAVTGATATLNGSAYPTLTHDTAGLASTLEFTGGSARATIGFPTGEVAGNTASAATALRRPAFNAVAANFYADYEYVQQTHLVAEKFSNLKDVQARHGLGSDLYTGALLALGTSGQGNEAPAILCMSVAADTLVAHQAAMVELEKLTTPTLVVPLTVVDGIAAAVQAHVDAMCDPESGQRERIGLVGVAVGVVAGDEDTAGTAIYQALALDSDKNMIFCSDWAVASIPDANGDYADAELDGCFVAAAVAGRIAALADRATPPTRKPIRGFSSLGRIDTKNTQNLLAEAGCLVLRDKNGSLQIRDGITTSTDSAQDAQIAIVLTEFQLVNQLRDDFDQYLGEKLLPDQLRSIKDRTRDTLSIFVKDQLIAAFDEDSIDVHQDLLQTDHVDVSFSYTPIDQIKEIDFSYAFAAPTALAA